eukprot:snap_masked-scaffold_75-processed-gene-0.23-mRNA-1 protein AED:1.00 eAED:1.00 QI:0/0/0/0/1/1/2/0/705
MNFRFDKGFDGRAMDPDIERLKLNQKAELMAISTKLRMLSNLRTLIFYLRGGGISDFSEIEEVCKTHPNLMYLEIDEIRNVLEHCYKANTRRIIKAQLRSEYSVFKQIAETRIVFIGDGRSGKTSTIKNMVGLDFHVKERSTLLLDLKYIIEIENLIEIPLNPTQLTRRDISLRRIWRSVPGRIQLEDDEEKPNNYVFSFEDELVDTVSEIHVQPGHYWNHARKNFFEKASVNYLLVSDFGGQESFYAAHHLFLSSFGVFCVVFDASKLDENHLERFKFWCDSLLENANGATIFVIATHWEKAKKTFGAKVYEIVNTYLSQVVKKLRAKVGIVMNENFLFFPVENSESKEKKELLVNLKQKLHSEVMENKYTMKKQFMKTVPLAHIVFMDNLEQEHTHVSLAVFEQKALKSGFTSDEISSLLIAYSDSGLILFEERVKNLPSNTNLVILSPSWLAKAISRFIHDPELHNFALQISKSSYSEYQKYISTGVLSLHLLEDTLKRYTSLERKFIIELCLQMHIFIKHPKSEVGEVSFIVPTIIPKLTKKEVKDLKIQKKYNFKILSQKTFSNYDFVSFILVVWMKTENESFSDENLVSRYFARIIISNNLQISITFLKEENSFGVGAHGYLGFNKIKQECLLWKQDSLLKNSAVESANNVAVESSLRSSEDYISTEGPMSENDELNLTEIQNGNGPVFFRKKTVCIVS